MAVIQRIANSASIFDQSALTISSSIFNKETPGMIFISFKRNTKRDFRELVDTRCDYLDSLKTLREDWISGGSVSPSTEVIEEAKKILIDFSTWLDTKESLLIPKLIMGPIPTGGIGIEFVVDGKFKIFLNIYNDSRLELEIEHTEQDHFIEIDTTNNSIQYLIKNAYEYLSL